MIGSMKPLYLASVLLFVAGTAGAQIPRFSIGPEINGLGVGGSASLGMGGFFSLSAEFGFIPIGDITLTEGDIDYTASPDIAGGVIAVNLHPLRNRFSVGVGLFAGGYAGDVVSESLSGTVEVGGQTYTVEDVGMLTGRFSLKGPGPIVMAGWRGKGFNFGVGLAFLGDPDIDLGATGRLQNDAAFRAELEKERQQIQDDAKLSMLPFFRLGYQFGLR